MKYQKNKDAIQIKHKNGKRYGEYCFVDGNLYELQRLQFTFTEALEEYEKGNVIESVLTGDKYKKENEKPHCCMSGKDDWFEYSEMEVKEIRGKWYINI